MRTTVALLLLAAAAGAGGQESLVQRTRSAAVAYLAEKRTPALAIAVWRDGRPLFEEGFGRADVAKATPARPTTVFRLGSISKPVTAVALMRLVELDRIRLDEDIRRYAPSFPAKESTITVRQVLAHQSGIRHYVPGRIDGGKPYRTSADAIEVFAGDPLLFSPGARYSYSTHAYTLLGAAIESAAGEGFDAWIGRTIRAKTKRATPRFEDRTKAAPRATLYTSVAGAFVRAEPDDISWKRAGGGMEASASDLAAFGDALARGLILAPASLKEMWRPQPVPGEASPTYALGWRAGPGFVAHGGSQLGAQALLMIFPESRTTIAMLSNLQGNPMGRLAETVRDIWTKP